MALADYQKKRRFTDTPEPKGKPSKGSGALRFVVQKHQASRLHYDFRLEMDGVLKSWAVPKGPSLDPADKRLAMMVEDHPFDYRTFEGTIPKGNYGAGTVMVWDEGTYNDWDESSRKTAEKTLKAGLHQGHITFKVHGKKLKGEFALVRSPGAGDNAWLLIKKDDEYAAKRDVTTEDRSAASGRSLDEIASGQESKPQLDTLLAAAPEGRPKSIKPMLATLTAEAFDRPGWLFEVKWDGYRIVAEVSGGKAKLTTRGDQDYTSIYQPVADDLSRLADCFLDGEMVVLDAGGRANFGALQNFRRTGDGNLAYMVFDILYAEGHDLTGLPLVTRKRILQDLLPTDGRALYSDHVETSGKKFYEAAKKQQLEGIMAKDGSSHYESGRRGPSWQKIKTRQRQEAIICGYTEPRGSRKHMGALVLGVMRDGQLAYIGHTGGKLGDADLRELKQRLDPLERKTSPFKKVPKVNAPVHWVRPQLVCEVSFAEWTADGHMRQPIFEGLCEDKPAAEVRPETVESPEPEQENRTETIGGHRLKLTNLHKPYWPDDGYTKGDLIEYYRKVASVMVPHLRNRPESMHRFPNGIRGQSFFQKDYDAAPDWAETFLVHSDTEDRDLHYLVCNDKAALLYMANLGCIEINPWLSTTRKPEHPTACVIDLDPEGIGFESVVEAALVTRQVLDEMGVQSYPKTSGATGIHIYIPLGGKYTYEQSKNFAHLVVSMVHAQLPDTTSIERSPAKRPNRIYLDYLQNRRGQTIAAAYSVRPRPGATVSTPLTWDEVQPGLSPSQFTIANMPQRIDKLGDLFAPTLGKGIDLHKILKTLDST